MKVLLATCILLATYAFAQEVPLRGPKRDPNPQATRPQTYQGCVSKSNGKLILKIASGKQYQLVSSARSLDSYIGQKVRVTASGMNPSDPSADERSVNSQEPQNRPATLDVEDIAKIADHCNPAKK